MRLTIILLLILLIGCGPDTKPENHTTQEPSPDKPITDLTYTNEGSNIKMIFPSNWRKQEGVLGTTVVFLSPKMNAQDEFQENINIYAQDISSLNLTLDMFTNQTINEIQTKMTDSEIIVSQNQEVSNKPGYRLEYYAYQGQYKFFHIQEFTIHNDWVYVITYTADINDNSLKPTANKMIESFEII